MLLQEAIELQEPLELPPTTRATAVTVAAIHSLVPTSNLDKRGE
jgi:hypothetical protein